MKELMQSILIALSNLSTVLKIEDRRVDEEEGGKSSQSDIVMAQVGHLLKILQLHVF